jgi:hypothetical protein
METKVRGKSLRLLCLVVAVMMMAGLSVGVASATPTQVDTLSASVTATAAPTAQSAAGCSSWMVPGQGWHSFAKCTGRVGKVRAYAFCSLGTEFWFAYGVWVRADRGQISAALCDRQQRASVRLYGSQKI